MYGVFFRVLRIELQMFQNDILHLEEISMRFLKDLLDIVFDFILDIFRAIFDSALFYMMLPFILSPIVLYWLFFTPSGGDGNIRAIDTPYSISISNYVALNENGLCGTYKEFVKDYVIYRQSERMKNQT